MSRKSIYIGNFILGVHYFLIIYINSSFLAKFFDQNIVNLLYAAGAALNVGIFISTPYFLSKINAKRLLLLFIALELLSVSALALSDSGLTVILFFILSQALAPIILYCMDLYLESALPDEQNTGWARAVFTTSLNAAALISFALVALIADETTFSFIYLLSAGVLVPLGVLVAFKFKEKLRKAVSFKITNAVFFLSKDRDALRILATNFGLQFFYSIMIIYLPFLLRSVPNFGWGQIGFIIFVMLTPFVILELPLGKLMDKKSGETEILSAGFVIMAIATITLAFLESSSLWVWAGVLFVSRIGASGAEIANESYFFKKVTDRNPNVINLFRITSSFSFIISPLVALPILYFTGYQSLFAITGFIMLLCLFFIPKKDTK